MALRDILVHIDAEDSEAGARRRDYALSLAATFESHLTGVVLALQPTMPPMVMGEVPGTLLESQRKSAIESANRAADEFVAAAGRAGVSYERRVVECAEAAASSVFASHARITDLVIAGQSGPEDYLALHELLVEAALFDSGRPVLIVPYAGSGSAKLDHVLVTWNGGREAARAMHDALPLLGKAGNVEIVVVGDWVSAIEPHEPGADVGHHLARHGLDVSVKRIAATGRGVSDTILSYASDVGADLVVMGGYGHSRLRQMVMGGVTRGMLQSMTVPVLMSH